VKAELGKYRQFKQILSRRGVVHDLMLQNPCEIVGYKDGVQAGCEGGVDI
jgi:hypothetical protein